MAYSDSCRFRHCNYFLDDSTRDYVSADSIAVWENNYGKIEGCVGEFNFAYAGSGNPLSCVLKSIVSSRKSKNPANPVLGGRVLLYKDQASDILEDSKELYVCQVSGSYLECRH